MRIFFQGGDAADHRKRLINAGVSHISLSYFQLENRIKHPLNWSLADHFPDDVILLLDSGAYSARKAAEDFTTEDWEAYVGRYCEFVEANLDRIDIVTEFDGVALGREYIEEMREDYWESLDITDKFMPVWHEEHGGLAELEKMAKEYDRVAITASALDQKRVMANRLNALSTRYGLKLHGLAITKPDDVLAVRFDSVSSTSWVSPMRFGDTIFWDGHTLRRYPKKYKEKARKRHKRHFEKAGFDAQKIADDDPSEVVRLSIWSWLQFEEALNRRKGRSMAQKAAQEPEDDQIAGIWDEDPETPNADPEDTPPAIEEDEVRNFLPVKEDDLTPLPVMGFETVATHDEQGNPAGGARILRSTKQSIRQCDTCYVAATCPAYEPGSACKFSIPVEIRTKEQLVAAMQSVVEMQMQRVAFARYSEELDGGYIDPNLSNEIDRFFGALGKMREINDNRDFLRIQVEGRAEGGVLSRLFGEKNAQATKDPIDPGKADEALSDIIDAEIVD